MTTHAVIRVGREELVGYFDFLGGIFGSMDSEREARIFEVLAERGCVYGVRGEAGLLVGAGQAPIHDTSLGPLRGSAKIACVSALATHPALRGTGVMRSIMTNILEDARADAAPFMQLFTDISGLYERFGFEPHGSYFTATVRSPAALKVTSDKKLLRPSPSTHLGVLHQIYDSKAAGTLGMLARDQSDWARQFHNRHASNGSPELQFAWIPDGGYVMYRRDKGRVVVSETVILDSSAWPRLWNELVGPEVPAAEIVFRRVSEVDAVTKLLASYGMNFDVEYVDTLYVKTGDALRAAKELMWTQPGEHALTVTAPDGSEQHLLIAIDSNGKSIVTEALVASPARLKITEGALARLALGGVGLHRLASEGGVQASGSSIDAFSLALRYPPEQPHIPQLL